MNYASRYENLTDPFILARCPLMPAETVWNIYGSEDPERALRDFFLENPQAVNAIAVSSTAMREQLEPWLAGRPLKTRTAFLRLLAYLSRLCVRTSPLGLFAGVGAVEAGASTTLRPADPDNFRVRIRPDMQWLLHCISRAEKDEARIGLTYRTNEYAIERGGRLFVSHPHRLRVVKGRDDAVEAVPISIRATDAVRFVREQARPGIRLCDLAQRLSEHFSAPPDASMRLLDQLVASGIILSELMPSPCGDPVSYVIERLTAAGVSFAEQMAGAVESTSAISGTPVSMLDLRSVDEVAAALRRISDLSPTPLQVDTYQGFEGTLGKRVLKDVYAFAGYQLRCAPYLAMREYRERFLARYEGNTKMVPLLELVDENFGLGMPPSIAYDSPDRASLENRLLHFAAAAIRDGDEEIAFTPKEFEELFPEPSRPAALPRSFEMGFQIAAASREAIDRGEYRITPSTFISSRGAARSAGRFLQHLPEDALERLKHQLRQSSDADVIDAELTYAPHAPRMYNVSIRPLLYDYEIAFGVFGGSQKQLDVTDLYVTLENDRFTIWSRKLGKRVRVHETHVLRTTGLASNVCRFLAMTAEDGAHTPQGFQWGAPALRMPYLPRVRVGNVVLSLRTWNVPPHAVRNDLPGWCAKWQVPRYVYFSDGDRRLALDLESPLAFEILRDQCKTANMRLQLVEALPGPGEFWLERDGLGYAAEFVITLNSRQAAPHATGSRAFHVETPLYGPASRWTYVKLYVGPNRMETLLTACVAPLIEQLEGSGKIERWFFIRYGDSSPHLRLRVLAAADDAFVREQILAACERWLNGRDIDKYALDTYEPEYDRYGSAGMPAVEDFFCEDSRRCIAAISAHADEPVQSRIGRAASGFAQAVAAICMERECIEAWLRRTGSPRKLDQEEWRVIKSLTAPEELTPSLQRAVANVRTYFDEVFRAEVFASDALHLHCNRLGLSREEELRVFGIVWHALKGRLARKESAPAQPARDTSEMNLS